MAKSRKRSRRLKDRVTKARLTHKEKIEEMLHIHKIDNSKVSPDEIYEKVKTFEDLLLINKAFLRGELAHTYYYFERWGNGEDQNTHSEAGSTLIKLHDYGVYTVNGQSDYCEIDKELKGKKYTMLQRSFVDVHILPELFEKLWPRLLEDERIYCRYLFYHKGEILTDNNFPEDEKIKFPLTTEKLGDEPTRVYTSVYNDDIEMDFRGTFYQREKNITNILFKTIFITVAVKEFCVGKADEVLLQIVQSLN